jgi:hypothetical protein
MTWNKQIYDKILSTINPITYIYNMTQRTYSLETHPNLLISDLQIGDIVNGKTITNIKEGKSRRTITYKETGTGNAVGRNSRVFNS